MNLTILKEYTKQDSIILNIQRACEASGHAYCGKKKLGLPQTSREAFDMLQGKHIIDERITQRLKAMVGIRKIAVNDLQTINLDILEQIVDKHLSDFTQFKNAILSY